MKKQLFISTLILSIFSMSSLFAYKWSITNNTGQDNISVKLDLRACADKHGSIPNQQEVTFHTGPCCTRKVIVTGLGKFTGMQGTYPHGGCHNKSLRIDSGTGPRGEQVYIFTET